MFLIFLNVFVLILYLFSDVKGCIADCNGFGTCDFLSGKCHCPGFNGPMCGKFLLAFFYSLKVIINIRLLVSDELF